MTVPIQISFAPEILGLGDRVNYRVAGPAARLAASASVAGSDSRNFANGSLTFTMTQNGESTDLFFIVSNGVGPTRVEVSGSNITFGGVVFATFIGGSGLTPLVVTFNANATKKMVSTLLKQVYFQSTAAPPSTRTFSVRAIDGDGLQSAIVTKQIFLV